MKSVTHHGDYCSDDDIFLSPKKKPELEVKHSEIPEGGIYEQRVGKLKSCLVGIPRPPVESVNQHFSIKEVELFLSVKKDTENDCKAVAVKDNTNLGRRKFGIYLNVDRSCEELERLAALFIEKYIPCETVSTMSDHSLYKQLTASAKKRRRCNGWATSPGSRLSYLARRKSTFSVDQVSKMGPASFKQFLLHRDQGVKVSLKPKRALFQSPDEDEKKKNRFRTPDIDERKRRLGRISMPNPYPIRTPPPPALQENRRERSCRKSLEFKGEIVNNRNECSDKRVKRKLLWAVSTALKSVSVTSSHGKFKECMNKLFKVSWTIWITKHQDKKSENSFSTSEAMLAVAKSLLEAVVLPELKNLKGDTDILSKTVNLQLLDEVRSSGSNLSSTNSNAKVVRTLTELTNSNNSSISPRKKTELIDESISESTFSSPSMRECVRNCSDQPNDKEETLSCNHKRKREEQQDEEEFMRDISSLDCPFRPSSSKKVCCFR